MVPLIQVTMDAQHLTEGPLKDFNALILLLLDFLLLKIRLNWFFVLQDCFEVHLLVQGVFFSNAVLFVFVIMTP